ncbi:MAG: acyl-CoA reductase, partial [Bacteroidia bacterium]|nr:acyl-CoA reductase [Bacteroidia bacterium]
MNKSDTIEAFAALGSALDPAHEDVRAAMAQAHLKNQWFTSENVSFCLNNWCKSLTNNEVEKWLQTVPETIDNPKTVGIVAAGNIPLVGLHDLLSVLGSGHNAKIKLSQNDEVLMKFCIEKLIELNPGLKPRIEIADRIVKPDAIIATGSNNTARYFEFYYKDIPGIIRKNRTSVAVLDGSESDEDLARLAGDIFQYFGLGCRS